MTELPAVFECRVEDWLKTARQPASEVKVAAGQHVVFTDFVQARHFEFRYSPPGKAGSALQCRIKGRTNWHLSPRGDEPVAKFLDVFGAEFPGVTFAFKV